MKPGNSRMGVSGELFSKSKSQGFKLRKDAVELALIIKEMIKTPTPYPCPPENLRVLPHPKFDCNRLQKPL